MVDVPHGTYIRARQPTADSAVAYVSLSLCVSRTLLGSLRFALRAACVLVVAVYGCVLCRGHRDACMRRARSCYLASLARRPNGLGLLDRLGWGVLELSAERGLALLAYCLL